MFTYNIQLAGYNYNQYDEKGTTDYATFIKVVEQFPWIEQLEKYNDIQQGCSATISVTNLNSYNSLWISITGDSDTNNHIIGYVYPKSVKTFLGLGKEKTKQWVDIYNIDDSVLIKELFAMFFNNNTLSLQEKLSQEEKFQSMAAKVCS